MKVLLLSIFLIFSRSLCSPQKECTKDSECVEGFSCQGQVGTQHCKRVETKCKADTDCPDTEYCYTDPQTKRPTNCRIKVKNCDEDTMCGDNQICQFDVFTKKHTTCMWHNPSPPKVDLDEEMEFDNLEMKGYSECNLLLSLFAGAAFGALGSFYANRRTEYYKSSFF